MASEIKWVDHEGSRSSFCWIGNFNLVVWSNGGGRYGTSCNPLLEHTKFRVKGGWEPAKAEALRLVREAVKRLSDAVGEP